MIQDEFYIFLAWAIFTALTVWIDRGSGWKYILTYISILSFFSTLYLLVRLSINFY